MCKIVALQNERTYETNGNGITFYRNVCRDSISYRLYGYTVFFKTYLNTKGMTRTEQTIALFEEHLKDYEQWFQDHSLLFESEVQAFQNLLPIGDLRGIEVGLGTGHLALALGIKEGVEPSDKLRQVAIAHGLEVMNATAEDLPYKDLQFDFVILSTALHYLEDIDKAFSEAYRVLKPSGTFLIGFLDPDSNIGKEYLSKRKQSTFYRHARFFNVPTLDRKLAENGFKSRDYFQTLFGETKEITKVQDMLSGTGSGSFVLIKATKNRAL
jgi:ubiquinone/menaquinone biosynthesis C-methylase UbiE